MKRNPFLKVEQIINKKVYGNVATLVLSDVTKKYNEQTGEMTEETREEQFQVYISNPHEISDVIVDGKYYIKGDLTLKIAYLELRGATSSFDREDDVITGGIRAQTDRLVFKKREYRIVKAQAETFFAGVPAKIKLQLRAV